MDTIYSIANQRRFIAVSSAGGVARQFRVQIFCRPRGEWQLWATFGEQQLADQAARECEQEGYEVRVIAFAISPAAA